MDQLQMSDASVVNFVDAIIMHHKDPSPGNALRLSAARLAYISATTGVTDPDELAVMAESVYGPEHAGK